ncbi:MAG TPA: HAD family phosphatase [Sphingobacteriaceae bacterium]|nr:HAD family phosphatase [Sphingobacteriaceae bacterium]
MYSKIKNIIFDYGNVIFLIDFKRTQDTFTELGIKNVSLFFGHTGHALLFDEFEKGKITSAEFRDGIRQITGSFDLTDSQIDYAWNTLLIGVPPENHDILRKANEKYRTFLLSNNNEIHYNWIMNYLKQEHSLVSNDEFFEKAYYSHLMGMRKPDPQIFELMMLENNLIPEETLFIDDSPQHINTANKLGLQTYLLTFPETLKSFMSSSGLI